MLAEGKKFPPFSLPDQNGKVHSLDSLKGKMFVIYFYPKDDTTGCTLEACGFRDVGPQFVGVPIFGVSPDSEKSHKNFATKYELTFTLLADTEHTLAEACGIWVEKSMYGKKYMGIERTTFLVDSDGIIQKIWSKVKAEGHAEAVLASIS